MDKPLCRLTGRVLHGKGLGRKLGFPTANIAYPAGTDKPADGVYAAVLIADGRRYPGVLNQGRHPTFAQGDPTVEIHLLDACADFYGRDVAVEYLRFLRPERRFESGEALKAQVEADQAEARAYFAGRGE